MNHLIFCENRLDEASNLVFRWTETITHDHASLLPNWRVAVDLWKKRTRVEKLGVQGVRSRVFEFKASFGRTPVV